MKIGLSQLVMRDRNLRGVMEFCKSAGYKGLEVLMTDDQDIKMNSTDAELKAVKEMSKELDIEMVSVCASVKQRGAYGSPDPAEAKLGMEVVARQLEVAAKLGINACLVIPGGVTPQCPYDVLYESALKGSRQVAKIAEKLRVHACLEFVWNRFLVSPLEMRQFLANVGSPYFNFFYDTGNMALFGFPEQWARICGKYIKKVHFKDFRRPTGKAPYAFTMLREGELNWPAIMKELRAIGYDDYVISEVGGDEAAHRKTAQTMEEILNL
jgi:hexulose-6-phosphate isomerase